MAFLTLLTDWGHRDHYVGAFKGMLLSLHDQVRIVDISHDIEPFDTLHAAFVLKNAYPNFPKGTVHYIGLNGAGNSAQDEVSQDYLLVETDGHYFVGIDSGVFSLLLGEAEKRIYRLPINPAADERKALQQQVANILVRLYKGEPAKKLGVEQDALRPSYFAQPTVDPSGLRGALLYIDGFGNCIFNITRALFEQEHRNRSFTIHLRRANYTVRDLRKDYSTVETGEIVALFNQDDFLEIAINRDNASKLLGMKQFDTIRIEFND
jgi:S-adenosylmethionine hydrolase